MNKISLIIIIMIILIHMGGDVYPFPIQINCGDSGMVNIDSRLAQEQVTTVFEDWSDWDAIKLISPVGFYSRYVNQFPQTPMVFHKYDFGTMDIYKIKIYASGVLQAYSNYAYDQWLPSILSYPSFNITYVGYYDDMNLEINGQNNLFNRNITRTYNKGDWGWPISALGNSFTYLIMGEASYQQKKTEAVFPGDYSIMVIDEEQVVANAGITIKQMTDAQRERNKELIIRPDPGFIAVEKKLEFKAYWKYKDGTEDPADAELWEIGATGRALLANNKPNQVGSGKINPIKGPSTVRTAGNKPVTGTIKATADGKHATASRVEYKVTFDKVGHLLYKNKVERQFTTLSETDIIYAAGGWEAEIHSKPEPGLEITDGTLVWSRDDSDKRLEGVFDPVRHKEFRWTKFTPADTYASDSNNNRIKVEYYDGHNNGGMKDEEINTMIVIPMAFWYFVPELQRDSKCVRDIYNTESTRIVQNKWRAFYKDGAPGSKCQVDTSIIVGIINAIVDNEDFGINRSLLKIVIKAQSIKESERKPHRIAECFPWETGAGLLQMEDFTFDDAKRVDKSIKRLTNVKNLIANTINCKTLAKLIIKLYDEDDRFDIKKAIRITALYHEWLNEYFIKRSGYVLGDNKASAEILAAGYNGGCCKIAGIGVSPGNNENHTKQGMVTERSGYGYYDKNPDNGEMEYSRTSTSRTVGYEHYQKNIDKFIWEKKPYDKTTNTYGEFVNKKGNVLLNDIQKRYIKDIGDKYVEYSK